MGTSSNLEEGCKRCRDGGTCVARLEFRVCRGVVLSFGLGLHVFALHVRDIVCSFGDWILASFVAGAVNLWCCGEYSEERGLVGHRTARLLAAGDFGCNTRRVEYIRETHTLDALEDGFWLKARYWIIGSCDFWCMGGELGVSRLPYGRTRRRISGFSAPLTPILSVNCYQHVRLSSMACPGPGLYSKMRWLVFADRQILASTSSDAKCARRMFNGRCGGSSPFGRCYRIQTRTVRGFHVSGNQASYRGSTSDSRGGFSPLESMQSRLQRRREAFGEKSLAARQLEKEIISGHVNATDFLKREMIESRVTPEMIRVCLWAEFQRIMAFSRSSRSGVLRGEHNQIARTVLDYLWRDQNLWMLILVEDMDARLALCYFAVAEELEDLVLRWLNVAIERLDLEPRQRGWGGYLFEALVKAHLVHATNHSASKPIKLFFRILDQRREANRKYKAEVAAQAIGIPPLAYLSCLPSANLLAKELATGQYHNTDAILYNKIFNFYRNNKSKVILHGVAREYNLAAMSAYHPDSPEFDRTLRFLNRADTEAGIREFVEGMPFLVWRMRLFFEHVEVELRRRDRQADADWVKRQAIKLLEACPAGEAVLPDRQLVRRPDRQLVRRV